jgi:hypothetical protein
MQQRLSGSKHDDKMHLVKPKFLLQGVRSAPKVQEQIMQ